MFLCNPADVILLNVNVYVIFPLFVNVYCVAITHTYMYTYCFRYQNREKYGCSNVKKKLVFLPTKLHTLFNSKILM